MYMWQLRTSLGKALSRKKDLSMSATSSPLTTSQVKHAASLPSIVQPQLSYSDQHNQQSVQYTYTGTLKCFDCGGNMLSSVKPGFHPLLAAIRMLGRSSGNHDWLLSNASACV